MRNKPENKSLRVLEKDTFYELLRTYTEIYGAEHIVYISDNVKMTCRELQNRADRMTVKLIKEYEIQPGDRLSLIGGNGPDWFVCFFAIIRAGAVAVIENPMLKGEEIKKHYNDYDVKLLITAKVNESLEDELKGFFGDKVIRSTELYSDEILNEDEKLLEELDRSLPSGRDAIAFFTSGSTSEPKTVLLSQEAVVRNARHLSHRCSFQKEYQIICVPLAHILGLVCAIRDMVIGATFVLEGNSIDSIVEVCRDYPVGALTNVPYILKKLATHPDFDSVVKPRIKHLVTGSASISPDEGDDLEKQYDAKLVCGYGMTEVAGVASMPAFEAPTEKRYLSVGNALEGIDIRIGDLSSSSENRKFCPHGELGEVLVKGDTLMNGYDRDKEPLKTIDEDGYLHTGDVGYLDEDGYLHLCGRLKNIIIKGGENILPGEIERCIGRLESVKGVIVVGVPDESYGEEIAALVIPKEGCEVTLEDIRAAVSSHCTKFKQPKYMLVYDSFPLTMVGKPDLAMLKKDACSRISEI